MHDFGDKELGKAIPYGIYDVSANAGWVTVGVDHDTTASAVGTLRDWWDTIGRSHYQAADRLLICADGGGSNGSRVRAWKIELAAFAADTALRVTVAHLPPGASKWNKIEHRLFSQITVNWRGRPLKTHQIIVDLITSTSTATGLTVHATLDTGQHQSYFVASPNWAAYGGSVRVPLRLLGGWRRSRRRNCATKSAKSCAASKQVKASL